MEQPTTQEELIAAGKRYWRQRISSKVSAIVAQHAKQQLARMYSEEYETLRVQIRSNMFTRNFDSGELNYPDNNTLAYMGSRQLTIEERRREYHRHLAKRRRSEA